jgi:hypothetical protein
MIEKSKNRYPDVNWTFIRYGVEIFAVILGAAIIASFSFNQGGQVYGTDTLMYLDTGLRGLENTFVLNRYMHIFIIRFFTFFGRTPIEGYKAFSGFLAFISTVLVYYSARSFSKNSSPINGVIAVGFLLSIPAILDRIMAPLVDTTVMIMMLAMVAIYIQSARKDHERPWLLVLFGGIFFMALRTKEVTIVAVILIMGFGLISDKPFSFSLLMKNLRYVIGGMVAAALIFIAINTIVLGSPLFGFRPADIISYREQWSATLGSSETEGATFKALLLASTGFIFVLYVSAGLLARKRMPRNLRLIWLMPLVLVAMLILFTTRERWMIVPRGITAGYALICVLGSQVVFLDSLKKSSVKSIAAATITALIGVGLLVYFGLATKGSLPYEVYFDAVFAPLAFSIIISILFLAREGPYSELAIIFLLLATSLYQIRLNILDISTQSEFDKQNVRFIPLLAFEKEITEVDEFNMFVTNTILPYLAIKENLDEISTLVNIALDLKTGRADYELGFPDESLIRGLEEGEYSHVLITSSEWDWLRTAPQDRPEWRSKYLAETGPNKRYILLKRVDISSSQNE